MASPAVHVSGAPGPAGSQQHQQQNQQQADQQQPDQQQQPAIAGQSPQLQQIRGAPVPDGWRRLLHNGEIVYFSPSGVALVSLSHVRAYLLTTGTCKCGLDCPLKPELVFDFDPKTPSVPWPSTLTSRNSVCLHKRKLTPVDIMAANKDIGAKRRKRSMEDWSNNSMVVNCNQQEQALLNNQMQQQQQIAQQMLTPQHMVQQMNQIPAQQQQQASQLVPQHIMSQTQQQQMAQVSNQQQMSQMTQQQQQQFYVQHEQQKLLQQQIQQHLQQQQNVHHNNAMRLQQQHGNVNYSQQGTVFSPQHNDSADYQHNQQLQQSASIESLSNISSDQHLSMQQMQPQMTMQPQNMLSQHMDYKQQQIAQQQMQVQNNIDGPLTQQQQTDHQSMPQQNLQIAEQEQIMHNSQHFQQMQHHIRQQQQFVQHQQLVQQQQLAQQQQNQQLQQQNQLQHHQQNQLQQQNNLQQSKITNQQNQILPNESLTQHSNSNVTNEDDGIQLNSESINFCDTINQTSQQNSIHQHNLQRQQRILQNQCFQQQQQNQRPHILNSNLISGGMLNIENIQTQNQQQSSSNEKDIMQNVVRSSNQPPWKQNQQRILNCNERVPPIQQHIQFQQQSQQHAVNWTNQTSINDSRKKQAPSRKVKKPRNTAVCPNVDVRDIHLQNSNTFRTPSFMDDPTGYLAQQTALLNNTMHRQQLENVNCDRTDSPVSHDSNNSLTQFSRNTQKCIPYIQSQQICQENESQNTDMHNSNSNSSGNYNAALNAQILQNCRSCSSSEEENISGNSEDGSFHVHTLPKNMDFMEAITVREEDPVTSSTFSSATPMDSVASPDCNSKGPIQGGTVSTSHKSPPELMPSPSPTPSLSSRGSDTPSSERSPNPSSQGELSMSIQNVTCYVPNSVTVNKPSTPNNATKLHPVMAAGNTLARNTITSVLAGRAHTATTSVSGKSSPLQNQLQQQIFNQNNNGRLVHSGNIALSNIQINNANSNSNGNVHVIGNAAQFTGAGIQMTRLPSGNIQFVQNIPIQNNQSGTNTVVQQAGLVQNALNGINIQNQTLVNNNGGQIVSQQLTTQQQSAVPNANQQQQNIIQNIQANNQQILQSAKVPQNYNSGHILVSSGGQILMSGNFPGTNLMPPPAPKSIIVGSNGMIQNSSSNVQLMNSNGNIVGNTVIANNAPNNVLVASSNTSGNNLLVANQTNIANTNLNNTGGNIIIGGNQNIVSNQGILSNGQSLNAQLQNGSAAIQNSNVVQGLVSNNSNNVVIGSSNILQNNQNLVTNNSGVLQNGAGMIGQQTVLVNAMPGPFVLQQGFTTVDGTHIMGNVIHQQPVVDQDIRSSNNNQFATRTAVLSPESKRKIKKRKPVAQLQQQNQQQQQQVSSMVQIQQNVPSQFASQGFQLSPSIGGLTLVSNKAAPSQILVNNQSANQGSFQTPHINLLQPLNILGPTVQQLIMPQLVMTQDAGLLQDATSVPLQLQIQNVNGQNMITPCQSILTTGPGGGVILRAPNPQTKNFISPGGGQFIVQNGQVSPLVTNVSPGQNVNLYGGSVGVVVPTQSGNVQQQNNTQTFVQQNTTIVQQQTTMMSNNNSSSTNSEQNVNNAASNNTSQFLLQSVNNSQIMESGNTVTNQQNSQRQHQQSFIIPVSSNENTSTIRHKYNVVQTVNTNHHIEQNTMTNMQHQNQHASQQQILIQQQQQQNNVAIDNTGMQYVMQQAQQNNQQTQSHNNQVQQNHLHQQQQLQQQNVQHQDHNEQQQNHNQQNHQHNNRQLSGEHQQQLIFHGVKSQHQISCDNAINISSVSTQTAGQQQQNLHSHHQQQQQISSLPPPDTTTHSPRSPDRPLTPHSFNDRHAMAMVHCISSSEPDSVVSPSADGGNSSPEDYCERTQRGNVFLHNNKPIHYQTDLKLRHSQCHQVQYGNILNQGLHHKIEANAENNNGNLSSKKNPEPQSVNVCPKVSSPQSSTSPSPTVLRVGDLVWGSARGFPAWPGKIIDPPAENISDIQSKDNVWVRWFGGRRAVELVSRASLQSLSEGLDAHHSARRAARKSRKLNTQLENAIQEAMAELDQTSNSGKSICKPQQNLQQRLQQNQKVVRATKLSQYSIRQVSKTPVKIAPHPIKMTVNNNLTLTSAGNINSNNNSATVMVQSNISTNSKQQQHVKSEDCVTARLRSAANNNNSNQR